MKRVCAATAAIFLSTFALAGCGDTSSGSTGIQSVSIVETNEVSSAAPTIIINGFEYQTPATVNPGQVVAIRNNGSATHSVTSDTSGLFSVTVEANEVGSFKAPTQAGTYTFHCIYHPSMHGTLKVK